MKNKFLFINLKYDNTIKRVLKSLMFIFFARSKQYDTKENLEVEKGLKIILFYQHF